MKELYRNTTPSSRQNSMTLSRHDLELANAFKVSFPKLA